MKKIGIVGGLGPEPTIDYYRIIIDSYRKSPKTEGSPEVIIYSLNLQAFLGMMEADQKGKAIDYLSDAVKVLYRAGADFAIIAAVTPHIFLEEIRKLSQIPLLSIVEETAKIVSKRGLTRVGLFGTKFTLQADFFHKVFSSKGISVTVPELEEQEFIHGKLVDELQFGRVVESTRKSLLSIVKRMIEGEKIEGLILGCTELPLILPEEKYGIPFFNTTKIHAESAVQYCLLDE